MSTPEQDPAAVFGQPQSTMSRLKDSIATQPSAGPGVLGAVKTGYAAGKQMASEQPGWATIRPQVGAVGVDFGAEHPSTVDQQGPPVDHTNANAPELASQESLDQLHSKVDALQGGMAGGGAAGNSGGNQASQQPGGPQAQQQQRESPLVTQARAHQQALEGMIASHANLADTRARFSQNASNRAQNTAAASRVAPAASAIGMSKAFSEQSFFGQQGSSNGVAPGTWESARWSR